MKKFEAFQIKDSRLHRLMAGAVIGPKTETNCATGYTYSSHRDKDSADIGCESVRLSEQTIG